MLPKHHALFSAPFVLFLWWFFPSIRIFEALIIFSSAILIDVDHYVYYVFTKKSFNLKKAFYWFYQIGKKYTSMPEKKRENLRKPICLLHGFESIIVIYLLTIYVSELFYFVLLGFLIHFFLDFIHSTYEGVRFHNFSVIYEYFRTRKMPYIENIK